MHVELYLHDYRKQRTLFSSSQLNLWCDYPPYLPTTYSHKPYIYRQRPIVVATAALKRKKAHETELDRLGGTRLQLEMQVNTLESANLNAETMAAMKKASDALKVIHGNLCVFDLYHAKTTIDE